MAWQSRKPLHENSPPNAAACGNHRYARPLRFESLEDRRLLAIIADTFSDAFGQVSRLVGSEATVLTLDTAGHYKVFYRPNDELGYIDPDTGSLLNADYYSGSSTVLVLDATVTGNISDLVGVTYSNGQAIATNGGNTVYHSDGSIMRSGGVWTYDAGATLEDASGNFFWSNGNSLKNGTTFKHANGATFGNATGTMFYASGIIFKNTGIGLFYPGAQTLRDASSNYFYAAGASLESGNVIGYSNGAVMVDSTGNVYNSSGTSSFTPFTRIQTIGSNEFYTHVENGAGDTVVTIENNTGGSFGAYVAHIHLTYQTPPNPVGIAVTAPDAQSLRFTWVSGGGSTTGYRVAVANGVSPPGDPATGSDTANNYYDVTGLTAGQKVSIRVWAKDGSGLLSTGVFATGTAGQYLQVPQTQQLIASSLGNTLAQIYDSVNQNIVYTVDQAGIIRLLLDSIDKPGRRRSCRLSPDRQPGRYTGRREIHKWSAGP
jgi:hypothetical protein